MSFKEYKNTESTVSINQIVDEQMYWPRSLEGDDNWGIQLRSRKHLYVFPDSDFDGDDHDDGKIKHKFRWRFNACCRGTEYQVFDPRLIPWKSLPDITRSAVLSAVPGVVRSKAYFEKSKSCCRRWYSVQNFPKQQFLLEYWHQVFMQTCCSGKSISQALIHLLLFQRYDASGYTLSCQVEFTYRAIWEVLLPTPLIKWCLVLV